MSEASDGQPSVAHIVTHTPPDDVNSLPAFIGRIRQYIAVWPVSIVPIDRHDLARLLDVAQSTYAGRAPLQSPQRAPMPGQAK
jgi:hypothetical protein